MVNFRLMIFRWFLTGSLEKFGIFCLVFMNFNVSLWPRNSFVVTCGCGKNNLYPLRTERRKYCRMQRIISILGNFWREVSSFVNDICLRLLSHDQSILLENTFFLNIYATNSKFSFKIYTKNSNFDDKAYLVYSILDNFSLFLLHCCKFFIFLLLSFLSTLLCFINYTF